MQEAVIHIENLKLRTIVGIFDWERKHKQDVIINVKVHVDIAPAAQSDCIEDTLDYKSLCKEIIAHVEGSSYFLVEKMADQILQIVLKNPRARKASVKVEKPQALRFADSVSISIQGER